MSRTADYTIKGFLYQFNKTLIEMLGVNEDDIINVEGIVEDVEIVTAVGITAIQCKYHEASESFSVSTIFKPLLQMMYHFHQYPDQNIQYILFAHFPSVEKGSEPLIGKVEFQSALDSTNKDFKKYTEALSGKIDLDSFSRFFRMEFGEKFDDIVLKVHSSLMENGILESDIETLAYPNAINMIANMSIKHDPAERSISKRQFLNELKTIRKTAISRWTLALRTRKQLLDAKRAQLKINLDKNSRSRYFVINSTSLDDFSEEIVLFINDYLEKYHFKPTHISTPLFCLCTTKTDFDNIQHRLFQKGIISEVGYIAEQFEESRFFRDPLVQKRNGASEREFTLRLLRWEDNHIALSNRKCDDLYVIGEHDLGSLNKVDVNIEYLAVTSLKEVKYMIRISDGFE